MKPAGVYRRAGKLSRWKRPSPNGAGVATFRVAAGLRTTRVVPAGIVTAKEDAIQAQLAIAFTMNDPTASRRTAAEPATNR